MVYIKVNNGVSKLAVWACEDVLEEQNIYKVLPFFVS